MKDLIDLLIVVALLLGMLALVLVSVSLLREAFQPRTPPIEWPVWTSTTKTKTTDERNP